MLSSNSTDMAVMTKNVKRKATPAKKYPAKSGDTIMISARLDPVTRYKLDLAARSQRRSLSDVITWAIDQMAMTSGIPGQMANAWNLNELARQSWSPNEIERIIQLGIYCPDILDFSEANIWRVIRATPELWNRKIERDDNLTASYFNWERLERQLAEVEAVIRDKAQESPVTGLDAKQIADLGWDASFVRDESDEIPF